MDGEGVIEMSIKNSPLMNLKEVLSNNMEV